LHADLQGGGRRQCLAHPRHALIAHDGGSQQVAVLTPGNIARLRTVTLGRDHGNAVDVVAGLAPGDRVIDSPPETLRDGDHVRLGAGAGA
jgi:hypothetical protein